jgi:hypothetical protein
MVLPTTICFENVIWIDAAAKNAKCAALRFAVNHARNIRTGLANYCSF